jgi:hypothetical protein
MLNVVTVFLDDQYLLGGFALLRKHSVEHFAISLYFDVYCMLVVYLKCIMSSLSVLLRHLTGACAHLCCYAHKCFLLTDTCRLSL